MARRYNPHMPNTVPVIVILVVLLMISVSTLIARRRGYNVASVNTIVRCREGHVFTTIWIPGFSLKAVRLGPFRLQRCPVGDHLTLVTPVRESDLTQEERRMAESYHDNLLP